MYEPPCVENVDMFFPDEEDGRKEEGRREREDKCKLLCFQCQIRRDCLRAAVVGRHIDGVWGAMGEGERRFFMMFIRRKGYRETPEGEEFVKVLNEYYEERRTSRKKRNLD